MKCAFCNNPSAELLANKLGIDYGQKVERERIIKLLDDDWFTKAFGRSKDFNAKRASLIALIKGENK